MNRRSTKGKKKAKDDNNVATYKKHFQSYKKERKTTNFEKMTNSNIENIESKKNSDISNKYKTLLHKCYLS